MQNTGDSNKWVKYYDEEVKAHYYFNPVTVEAKWTNPNEDHESDLNSLSSRIKSEIKSEIINEFEGIVFGKW